MDHYRSKYQKTLDENRASAVVVEQLLTSLQFKQTVHQPITYRPGTHSRLTLSLKIKFSIVLEPPTTHLVRQKVAIVQISPYPPTPLAMTHHEQEEYIVVLPKQKQMFYDT